MNTSIKDRDALVILKPDGEFHLGLDQEFYTTKWKRLSGCGPTAASNLYLYHLPRLDRNRTMEEGLAIMDEIWKYVTPRFGGGVKNTKIFMDGMSAFLRDQGKSFTLDVIDVPKKKELRKPLVEVREFVRQAIDEDLPIAFLNLHNGEEKQLDAWHWVTVVGIEMSTKDEMYLDIFDGGKLISVNLDQWYAKTKDGGGFVVYRIQD
ncbi:MAG TPA: hypothetical protein DCQ90_08690 [Erysipelotrichaceae bacterium]|nr:hypothetical protein [Erysipelotrichaceae bacterium]